MARPRPITVVNSALLTPTDLRTWLEWAGARLIAMPSDRIKPAELKCLWPEYSQDKFQVLEHRPPLSIRAMAPSSKEITIVDEILLLPNLCSSDLTRRIIHARSLVHPIRGHYLHKWSEIALLVRLSRPTVMNRYKNGLKEITEKVDPEKVCRISSFFDASLAAYHTSR